MIFLNVLGADLQAKGNALHFIFGEFPAGGVVGIVHLDTDNFGQSLFQLSGLFQYAGRMLGNRDNNRLNRSDCRGKHQPVVVSMGHDDRPDDTGGHAPGGLVRVLQGVVPPSKCNVERLGKPVSKIMAGPALESLSVMHHGLNGIGCLRAGEFFLVGFASLDDRDGKEVFTYVSIDVQHPLGFFNCLLGGFVHGVTLLPPEFHGSQEGTGSLLPPDNRTPLIVQLGQVPIGMYYMGVMLTEQRL